MPLPVPFFSIPISGTTNPHSGGFHCQLGAGLSIRGGVTSSSETPQLQEIKYLTTMNFLSVNILTNTLALPTVATIRKNGGYGTLTVNFAAFATGTLTDSTHVQTYIPGDTYDFRWDSTSGSNVTGPNLVYASVAALSSGATEVVMVSGGTISGRAPTASSTLRANICGSDQNTNTQFTTTVESTMEMPVRSAMTAKYLFVSVSANAGTNAAVYNLRKNQADGNMAVTITTGITGRFYDSTHTDSFVSGDTICTQITTGSGTQPTIVFQGCGAEPVGLEYDMISNRNGGIAVSNGSASTPIGGPVGLNNGGVVWPTGGTASNLLQKVIDNNGGTATMSLLINGVAGNCSSVRTSATAGVFEDTTHTDTFNPGDTLYLSWALTSGTMQLGGTVFKISNPTAPANLFSNYSPPRQHFVAIPAA